MRNSYNHFSDARCILCVHTGSTHTCHTCGCTHEWHVLHCAHTRMFTCIQNTGYIDLRKSNKQIPTCVHKVVEDDPHTCICMSSPSDMLSQWPVANWPLHYTALLLVCIPQLQWLCSVRGVQAGVLAYEGGVWENWCEAKTEKNVAFFCLLCLCFLWLQRAHWHCMPALILPTVALSNFAISTASGQARSSV